MLAAIPVTLALTLFVFSLYGYTLNRITLFALIFSIGILVDDAIVVVVENIVRHARAMKPGGSLGTAVRLLGAQQNGEPAVEDRVTRLYRRVMEHSSASRSDGGVFLRSSRRCSSQRWHWCRPHVEAVGREFSSEITPYCK